ncbi:hypothetical protein MKQ68_16550 [Chitinophaga horti]|uniref:ZU5 domain-containing protein n=1 Tax=Chitinophaga horti TaxID=2920382 RepID=A0ABY6IWE4_9BACT|nr:hypothetical protein [Chitinophaga horti]UYQ91700.1 hypothetical protein MKQ68_16550 [Chitinophaga horti]
MKSISAYLVAALLTFTACSKPDSESDPNPIPGTGKVTEAGAPDEDTKAEKVIGTAGGTLTSNDGEITIDIPAGALAANQTVSIQRITNKNPMGLRKAYRLLPHGVQFTKPVNITFDYSDEDITGTIPEALGIAYQDDKGIWQAIGSTTLDKDEQTISVKTTHFSDWSFFESFVMKASATFVDPGTTVQLEIESDANIMGPLQNDERPIGERHSMSAEFVKGWKLAGAGTLTPNKEKATYKAPATVPTAPNPVAVSAEIKLNKPGLFLVLTHITIADDGEISVRVNGGAWITQKATAATKFGDNYYGVADGDGDETGRYIFIRWTGGVGTTPFKSPKVNYGTHSHYQVNGNTYICSYVQGEELVASGGGVTITSMGEKGGFIEGTADINPAGYGPKMEPVARVEAKFKVRRYW